MDYDLFDSFVEDLLGEKNARPVIIIGASRIDDVLFQILKKYLLPKSANITQQDELLEGDNPIGTFSSRIKMVYRLGIIDVALFKALERVRAIRNKSAHSIEFNPQKSPIREHISELKKIIFPRKSYTMTKDRYFKDIEIDPIKEIQCTLITICVLLEAISEIIYEIEKHNDTVEISNK